MDRRVSDETILTALVPSAPLTRIGHRELRDKLGPTLAKVSASHGALEVVNRGRPEAVVVASDVFAALVASRRELDEVRSSVALLLAAVSSGAAVPSDTLVRLGIVIPLDFDVLQTFQATYPAKVTHDEDGQPMARVPALVLDSFRDDFVEPDEFVDVDE